MALDLDLSKEPSWQQLFARPFLIAGPCSAESEEQVLTTAQELAKIPSVRVFRSGVWKPRTRPFNFEGRGPQALEWLKIVKQETGLPTATEVATTKHCELALKAGIDYLWLGARTTVNPFLVDEVASALEGTHLPLLVKNPINPDLNLWIGALERLRKKGHDKLIAVHRGFSSYGQSKFRNTPHWEIPIRLKCLIPDLPLLCDPSHITGQRKNIQGIAQKAFDLQMDGLMIESHCHPDRALSDSLQQITPISLALLLKNCQFHAHRQAPFPSKLMDYRNQIDTLDLQMIEILAHRLKIVEKIRELKFDEKLSILQVKRWQEMMAKRENWGHSSGLAPTFLHSLFQLIHEESLQRQLPLRDKLSESSTPPSSPIH